MRYGYRYHDHEGIVRSGEIDAESRESAFQILKQKGFKPMQFWLIEKTGTLSKRTISIVVLSVVVMILGITLVVETRRIDSKSRQTYIDSQEPISDGLGLYFAVPCARRCIEDSSGSRELFKNRTESYLAQFAEPGSLAFKDGNGNGLDGDIMNDLREGILISENDPRHVVEMKRIVAGIKEDVLVRLSGGASVEDVRVWLESRQRMERAYFDEIREKVRSGLITVEMANRTLRPMGLPQLKEKK